MSLFSPTPIVSVVVPCFGDEAAFESTLVSVLENRPRLCEVIVAHDGSYADPFELEDEVRFAVADGHDLPALVRAGAEQAKGRLVHVLAEGYRATDGWIDEILSLPSDNCPGLLAPVAVRNDQADRLATVGWRDCASGFCAPIAAGKAAGRLPRRLAPTGPILQASIWRTDLLRAVAELPTGRTAELTQYAWARVAHMAGFDCQVASDCRVIEGVPGLGYGSQTTATARQMQAVRGAMEECGGGAAVASGLLHLACNVHRPAALPETIGRLTAALTPGRYQKQFAASLRNVLQSLQEASGIEQELKTVPFPSPAAHEATPAWQTRRAA